MHHQALATADARRPGRPHFHRWILLTDLVETCATIPEVEVRPCEVDRDEGMILFVVDGKTDEFAVLECGRTSHVRRTDRPWLAATNHACRLGGGSPGPDDADSVVRQARLETMATALLDRATGPRLPGDLVAIGGVPAASRGDWQPIAWPWGGAASNAPGHARLALHALRDLARVWLAEGLESGLHSRLQRVANTFA